MRIKILNCILGTPLLVGGVLPIVGCSCNAHHDPQPEPELPDLCFQKDENATEDPDISFSAGGGIIDSIHIQYKLNNEQWKDWPINEYGEGESKTLHNGDKLYVRNTTETLSTQRDGSYNHFQFASSGMGGDGKLIKASGNINSLVNYAEVLPANSFSSLFYECYALTTAPDISFQTVKAYSCYDMFHGCSNLTTAPDTLPAQTLEEGCYSNMFEGCWALENAPELPAEQLAEGCYSYMFSSCRILETAPDLLADGLAKNCYYHMFENCLALENAPELPAEQLAEGCYSYMFEGCNVLETAPNLPAQQLAERCYENMFWKCTSLKNAPELLALNLPGKCYYCMFQDCESLKVNEDGEGTKIFTCPSGVSGQAVTYMFLDAGGTFKGETPTAGHTYYWYTE
ncbi:MAG: hypothetical protein ACOQNV_03315 [Mycoplasmoidaceae bacterium]